MATAAVRPKGVVLLVVDSLLHPLFVVVSWLVIVLLSSTLCLSSFAIISLRKRELVALL